MLLAADEDFNRKIVRGLVQRNPEIDIVRVQDVDGLPGADDPTVLEWAAGEGRVLLSHDFATMRTHAYDRVSAGLPMPGVFLVRKKGVRIARVIEEFHMIVECSFDGEWEGQVRYVPL